MTALARILVAAALVAALAAPAGAQAPARSKAQPEPAPQRRAPDFDVLVFSRTTGFRHDSIPTGIATIKRMGERKGFRVVASENPARFTGPGLRRFEVVIFLNTTGDVLGPSRKAAFVRYIRKGGGFAGVHSATDTEADWPFYRRLVGATFDSHPAQQQATIQIEDHVHPSTRHLPDEWVRTDEWYNFAANPRLDPGVHVLATIDESTYTGGNMGADHPIAWCQVLSPAGRKARSWYTNSGHRAETYAEAAFRRHLLGGIRWAAGAAKGNCRVPSA